MCSTLAGREPEADIAAADTALTRALQPVSSTWATTSPPRCCTSCGCLRQGRRAEPGAGRQGRRRRHLRPRRCPHRRRLGPRDRPPDPGRGRPHGADREDPAVRGAAQHERGAGGRGDHRPARRGDRRRRHRRPRRRGHTDRARSRRLRGRRRRAGHHPHDAGVPAGPGPRHRRPEALRRYERAGLTFTPLLDGGFAITGTADETTGAALIAAIDTAAPLTTGDTRTAARRRLDGLHTLARHWLDTAVPDGDTADPSARRTSRSGPAWWSPSTPPASPARPPPAAP